jgi:hypothetical protein
MRYYKILITNVATRVVTTYTSLSASGITLLGALNIELDFPIVQMSAKNGNAILKIWGVSLESLSQAFDLNPAANGAATNTIQVSAGMAKGLPLANPSQAGIILEGEIRQAFGNAIGVDRYIEFVISATNGTALKPKNLSHPWPNGMNLGVMIKQVLAIAYPALPCTVNVNPNLVLNQAEPGFWGNLFQFAQYVKEVSQHIIGGNYPGVNIVVHGNGITVYDGTVTPPNNVINFNDLIGQPTWQGPNLIQFSVVMRSDLNVGETITLPKTSVITAVQPSGAGSFKNAPIFQGTFSIIELRHVGNFRQGDAASWVSVVTAVRVST